MEVGVGTALLFTGLGLQASRNQEKLDQSRINYETEANLLAVNQSAYESSRQFRQALGVQIATAGARGGVGSSDLRQFTTESYANYLSDQATIGRKAENTRISGTLARGQAAGERRTRDMGLLAGLGSSLLNSTNLNKTGSAAPKLKGK